LLSVTDHCLRRRQYDNVIVAGKQPELQWLDMDAAVKHCTAELGIWKWASNDERGEPDVINVVDLMALQPQTEHPHGMSDQDFDVLFTQDKPVVFAYHGYPSLIHCLTYRRTNHNNLHVRGYKEEGTTTTPFDRVVLNDIDRFHLAKDVIDRVAGLGSRSAYLIQVIRDTLIEHRLYISKFGEDMPAIREWKWDAKETAQQDPVRK
jgi:xylulose-5-phosphate/fructose-6-phosphate phosphoketolase